MNTDKSVEQENPMERLLKQLIPGIAGLLVVVLGAYIVWFSSAKVSHDSGDWGTLGDYFGGLMNPVISFATLMVAYAVWKQQRQELRETKEALKEQAKTAELQRQEQRFFDILNLYQQTVSAISVVARMPATGGDFPVHYSGKEAIAQFLRSAGAGTGDLVHFDKHGFGGWKEDFSQVSTREGLLSSWEHEVIADLFDHYIRVVHRILSEAENFLGEQHHRYVELFRAQFSRSELTILGFYIWLDEEGKYFNPLAKKYGLLKDLPKGHLRSELEKLHPELLGGSPSASTQS